MWEDMANSIAIDEQRALRHRFSKEPIEDYGGPAGDYEDDEADPNNSLQPAPFPGNPAGAPRPVGMFDSDSEDESPPASPPQPNFDLDLFDEKHAASISESLIDDTFYIRERNAPLIAAY